MSCNSDNTILHNLLQQQSVSDRVRHHTLISGNKHVSQLHAITLGIGNTQW